MIPNQVKCDFVTDYHEPIGTKFYDKSPNAGDVVTVNGERWIVISRPGVRAVRHFEFVVTGTQASQQAIAAIQAGLQNVHAGVKVVPSGSSAVPIAPPGARYVPSNPFNGPGATQAASAYSKLAGAAALAGRPLAAIPGF